jgi:hypothetical protein
MRCSRYAAENDAQRPALPACMAVEFSLQWPRCFLELRLLSQTYNPRCCSTARVCHHPELEAQTDAVATSCSHVLVLIGTGVQFLHCLPACLLSSACSGHGAFWSLGPLMLQTYYPNRRSTELVCHCSVAETPVDALVTTCSHTYTYMRSY